MSWRRGSRPSEIWDERLVESAGGILDYFRGGLPSLWLARTLALPYLLTLALTVAMIAKAFSVYGACCTSRLTI